MSEQTINIHTKEQLFCSDVDGFDALAELAMDMRSSWNHATDQVWPQLDPVLWDQFKNSHLTQTYPFENHLQIESAGALLLHLLRPYGQVLFNSEQSPLKPVEGDILPSYVPPSSDQQQSRKII